MTPLIFTCGRQLQGFSGSAISDIAGLMTLTESPNFNDCNANIMDVNSTDSGNNMNYSDKMTEDMVFTPRLWAKHIGMLIIACFAVVGNGLLIYTIARNRHLRTFTNALIMSLAMADFTFGFPTMPLHVLVESMDGSTFLGHSLPTMCLLTMSLTAFELMISTLTMLVVMLERYACILHPLKHKKWSQQWVVVTLIVSLWVYCLIIGTLPLMGWNNLQYYNSWGKANVDNSTLVPRCSFLVINTGQYMGFLYLLHTVPVCISIPFLYGRMFWAIRQFLERKMSYGSNQMDLKNGRQSVREMTTTLQQTRRRSLRLLVVITIYFVCSWLPVVLWYAVVTVGFTRTFTTPQMISDIPFAISFYQGAVILGFANSAINPYIYGLGNMRIRKAIFRMFSCGYRRRTSIQRELVNGYSSCVSNRHVRPVYQSNSAL